MADPPPRRPTQQRGRAQPPAPGQQGWRVTPAPDGRGAHGQPRPPSPRRSRWWIAAGIVVFLLAINLWVSSQALQPPPPVRIPYSPQFLDQVQAKNVKTISSTGDAISGTLKRAVTYPSGSTSKSTNFSTQIPSFADNAALEAGQVHSWTFPALDYASQADYMTKLAGWLEDSKKVS